MTSFRTLALLLLLAPACDAGGAEPAAPVAPTAEAPATAQVARVVFIGQAESCDCTRKRIDDGIAALTAAIGERDIPVERIQADVAAHREQVEMLRELRPFMVAPGIFLFDADDNLVGMTQGETTADELQLILGG
jgi:hypothetical protein